MKPFSDYDGLAWVYNKYWGSKFVALMLTVLDKLVLEHLPKNARILDLCCGTGQLAQALSERGYQVTGLDGSREMIRIARENAPGGEFVVRDARRFRISNTYDAVVSAFDRLNHIMTTQELILAFGNVHASLRPGGRFLFDLNMQEGYRARWRGTNTIIEGDHVCIIRFAYRDEEKTGESQLTSFRLQKRWQRQDLTLLQKCYSEEEVRSALGSGGFKDLAIYDGQRDLQLTGKGTGRAFFLCRKSA
jgi:SAM-dependent methyltransferase